MAEQNDLLEIASAVADQDDVDWASLERNVSDEVRSIVKQLRVLHTIAGTMDAVPGDDASVAPDSPASEVPQSIGQWGHLRLIAEISRGSFGIVYRAWDTRLECHVAVKLARTENATPVTDPAQSLTEARLLARVRHHNVVTVHGADCFDNRFGLWMELVNGHTLEQLLEMHGPLSGREAAQIGVDLCHALAAVHGAGLLHRDIKATNVMREGGGRILLMDFSAGRGFPVADGSVKPIVGTPLYLAPELFTGGQPSRVSDIYSLGVLLYHLVTRSYPVKAETVSGIALAHQRQQRALLRDARPDLPPAFIDVIERALAVRPTDRYATAGAFGDALAGTAGIHYGGDERTPRSVIDSRLVAAAAIVAVVIGIATWQGSGGNNPAQNPSAPPSQNVMRTSAVAPASLDIFTTYDVEAAFYTVRKGQRVRMASGGVVEPGDKLFLNLSVSRPVYVYLINQDEHGSTFLLFPLPGQQLTNPVPLGAHRLPGPRDGEDYYWEVTSAGNREHFLLYVSPERLADFEPLLAALARAEAGRPVTAVQVPAELEGALRSVGGVVAGGRPSSPSPGSSTWWSGLPELPEAKETATGVWARQITFRNP